MGMDVTIPTAGIFPPADAAGGDGCDAPALAEVWNGGFEQHGDVPFVVVSAKN